MSRVRALNMRVSVSGWFLPLSRQAVRVKVETLFKKGAAGAVPLDPILTVVVVDRCSLNDK